MMFETGWPQENISNLTFKVLISANARFLSIELVNHWRESPKIPSYRSNRPDGSQELSKKKNTELCSRLVKKNFLTWPVRRKQTNIFLTLEPSLLDEILPQ